MNKLQRVEWRLHTTLYEVNIRQYTPEGTFKAFAAHLPRLRDMGIETLWLMPITPIASEKMKGTMGSYYACSDYTSINPEFGTLDDFRNLVSAAHELGFKVILDWVANHTGWDHIWTITNPGFYKREASGAIKTAHGMDDIIELDYGNPALRETMIAAMRFWITECNIDGFRCDLASWVPLEFWKKARKELERDKPLFWLGEMDAIDDNPYLQVFDVAYAWKWMHATETFYKKDRSVIRLTQLLQHYNITYPAGATALFFTSNHDENSWNGTEYEKYGDMALLLAVLSCTWQGIPLVYSGQEMPLHKRLMFFDKDEIGWDGQYRLHEFYKKLLHLHLTHPALSISGSTEVIHIPGDEHILAYIRKKNKKWVLTVLNLSPYPATINIIHPLLTANPVDLFSGESKNFAKDTTVQLPQWGYKVYVL
ncbi:MAG: alpha-glucosidase C-terminal domain-containing protein [Chitinophagaceae bacterium]|nr:alpha-glucosidase C-terminal domain-containing protein [Chitinophagaceae bacterium]MCW5927326.1 alpha-glucosidase C-terminal domain-containing protein [Chitinophagaceae bacterium]